MAERPRRYWDSDCFIGFLADEPEKIDACRGVIRAAEKGELIIVTSSLALAEVVRIKNGPRLPASVREQIRLFFMNDWIVVRQLDRFLADAARDLFWDYGIDPKDAVHVATALANDVVHLDTFDRELIKRSGKIGSPPLVIGNPFVEEQLELSDAPAEGEDTEEIELDMDAGLFDATEGN